MLPQLLLNLYVLSLVSILVTVTTWHTEPWHWQCWWTSITSIGAAGWLLLSNIFFRSFSIGCHHCSLQCTLVLMILIPLIIFLALSYCWLLSRHCTGHYAVPFRCLADMVSQNFAPVICDGAVTACCAVWQCYWANPPWHLAVFPFWHLLPLWWPFAELCCSVANASPLSPW